MNRHGFRSIFFVVLALSCVATTHAASPDVEFSVAAGHYRAQRWKLAAESFGRFTSAFSQDPRANEAVFYRAESLAQMGEYKQARQLLAELLDSGVAGRHAHEVAFRLGEMHHLAGDHEGAISQLQQFGVDFPDSHLNETAQRLLADTQLLRAQQLLQHGQVDESTQMLLVLAANDRLRVEALFGLGRAMLQQSEWHKAQRYLQQAIEADAGDDSNGQLRLALAAAFEGAENYDAAMATLQEGVTKSADDDAEQRFLQRMIYLQTQTGRFSAAMRTLDQLRTSCGDTPEVTNSQLNLAEHAYRAGERAMAAKLFDNVHQHATLAQTKARALSGLAWCQLRNDDLTESTNTFANFLRQFPNDPLAAHAAYARGQILQQRGKYDAALAMYNLVTDNHAGSEAYPDALYAAARLHDHLNQFTEARSRYEQFLDQDASPQLLAKARYHLGWVLYESGQIEQAIAHWRNLHQSHPDADHWTHATYLVARHWVQKKQYDRATEWIEQLLARPTDDTDSQVRTRTRMLATEVALAQGDWHPARQQCQKIVETAPDDPLAVQAQFWVAEASYRLEEFDEAAVLFADLANRALGTDAETNNLTRLRHAQLLARSKNWHEAFDVAQRLVDEVPGYSQRYDADYVVGRCHAATGDFEMARRAYQRVLDSPQGGRTETAAMAQWMIGESFMHQGNYEQAVSAYLRGEVLYSYPQWQARGLLQAGKCYELLGQFSEAVAAYRRAVDKYPDSDAIAEIQTRMEFVEQRVAMSGRS